MCTSLFHCLKKVKCRSFFSYQESPIFALIIVDYCFTLYTHFMVIIQTIVALGVHVLLGLGLWFVDFAPERFGFFQ